MKYTKSQRHEIYKEIYEYFKTHEFKLFLCNAIYAGNMGYDIFDLTELVEL